MKKNNQWQKPDLNVMNRSEKSFQSSRKLHGLGVPPAPAPFDNGELYGLGVPPAPTPGSSREIYGKGVPPRPPAVP